MLYYLVTGGNYYTTTAYLKSWGRPLATDVRRLFYEQIPTLRTIPLGGYIFSDVERLSPREAELAAQLWERLAATPGVRLLNHPTRSMRRYELLRTLYERGTNHFNVYRLTEQRAPQQFPVFLRGENDHGGSLTPLLHTPAELDAAIRELEARGAARDDKLIVEFCDTSDADGTFRKYSAFVVGDTIIPTHIFFARQWLAKVEAADHDVTPAMVAEERHFVETNPHAVALRDIARLARIEYGRIDYAVRDGALQVWEINTNPMLPRLSYGEDARRPVLEHSTRQLNAALGALSAAPVGRIANPVARKRLERLGKALLACVPAHLRPYARRRLKDLRKRGRRLVSPTNPLT